MIDVAPTILEAANIEEPEYVNGIKQIPMQGTSMVYTFNDGNAKERHTTQYFEIIGNRGVYQDGWLARATVSLPWEAVKNATALKRTMVGAYNVKNDYSLSTDLAAQYPDKLEAMKEVFMEQAIENHVLLLDDRLLPRLIPKAAGRQTLGDRTTLTLYPGAYNLVEDAILNFKMFQYSLADIDVSKGRKENGVIFSQVADSAVGQSMSKKVCRHTPIIT